MMTMMTAMMITVNMKSRTKLQEWKIFPMLVLTRIAGVDEAHQVKMDKADEMDEAPPPNNQEEMAQDAPYEEEIAGVDANIAELQENNNDDYAAADNNEAGNMEADDDEQSASSQDEPGALDQVEADIDARYGKCNGRYNLHTRRPHNYSHLFVTKLDDYRHPIQRASHHKDDHHGATQGTHAGNNMLEDS